ncbi:MAG: hydroxymethylbilane synthase [Alphaproteobacteria bacterium]
MMTSDFQPGQTLRLGTRGSPLAMAQAVETKQRIAAAAPQVGIEIVDIKTTGDKVVDRRLAEIGGKGLFTKELDDALLDGRIDFGVHSMKDMETWLPDGIEIAAVLPREDPRDALVSYVANSIDSLPKGAVIGTASLRRQAQLLARRPDLSVVMFRGNVQTRLEKLARGEAAATFLATAGLNRLGVEIDAVTPLETDTMLPAVAQGAIAITVRAGDDRTRGIVALLNDAETAARTATERGFLAALDGSCRTPIAGLAELSGDGSKIMFRGLVVRPDGSGLMTVADEGPVEDAEEIGLRAGRVVRPKMDRGYFE